MLQKILAGFAALPATVVLVAQQAAPPVASNDLAKAIAEMRHVPAKLTGKEAEERGGRIQAAWETLIAAKDAGAAALLAEATKLDAAKEKDDKFRLGAATVVWQIGHFDRVTDIVTLWGNADFAAKYNYAFPVAFEAAIDADERALPLLVALLRDQTGEYFITQHVMNLGWPLTHYFLWGPMGQKAVPALEKVLATEKDPTVLSSAVELLIGCWDVAALPQLRVIASDSGHGARRSAIRALGRFGHPDDFEFLCAGLDDRDPKVVRTHIFALCAFGDLRAVPHLLPLSRHADEGTRLNALSALGVLPTVDGLETLAQRLAELGHAAQELSEGPELLHAIDVSWDAYQKLDRAERVALLTKAIAKSQEDLIPKQDDRKVTREEFESSCKSWIAASRLGDEEHEWAESLRVLAAATPADVPLLRDVRGCLFRRLSDECLEEIRILDTTLQRLIRSQYRAESGICERVTPISAAKSKVK